MLEHVDAVRRELERFATNRAWLLTLPVSATRDAAVQRLDQERAAYQAAAVQMIQALLT